ncbi:MAG: Crp/Fnr family transcriptional regulator, partial [Candidatus Eremiobacteraeota bacterium]|nr:Crp/Fnr family transcriptional regulator [Candidatus Eremiobacteraeota bacterium]
MESLEGSFEVRHLDAHFALNEPGEAPAMLCFPLTTVASTVACMQDGDMIEAVTIGNEGIVGISAILGGDTGTLRSFIQVPGIGCLIPTSKFLRIVESCPQILQFLMRYANVLINVISQSAACNRLHN